MQTLEYRPTFHRLRWCFAAVVLLGVAAACWVTFGMGWEEFCRRAADEPRNGSLRQAYISLLIFVPLALFGYHWSAGRTRLDDDGIRTRTPLRRQFIPWHDITSIEVDRAQYSYRGRRGDPMYRIRLDLTDGRSFCLPAPASDEFDSALEAAKGEIIRRWKTKTA
ncbi:PH domain-containing protein [Streptomyces sp. I05A-00742]|uniref:PH domain-containing protein n=1 Tax=Streptomyces sp. I05A-00742 TaxID=2732853 RepID=UPI0014882994|nr:PH domain-containing protein [Streptomyces sp. I05A-00742]